MIKSMHNDLKRLHSVILAEGLPLPRPIPTFRTVEYAKDDSQKEEKIIEKQKLPGNECNEPCHEHKDIIANLKLLQQEKDDLTNNLIELNNRFVDLENQNNNIIEEKDAALKLLYQEQNRQATPDYHQTVIQSHKSVEIQTTNENILPGQMTADDQSTKSFSDLECQTEYLETVESTKMKLDQVERKCCMLMAKLEDTLAELDRLRHEKTQKWILSSVDEKESQTEHSDEYVDALSQLKSRYQQATTDHNKIKSQLSNLQHELIEIKKLNIILQENLNQSKKKASDLDDLVKQLNRGQRVTKNEHNKQFQNFQEIELQRKMKSLISSLDIEDNKKELLITPLNQLGDADKVVQHMKLVYGEFVSTNKCNKEQEKRLKHLEAEYLELTQGKEKLERRIQKLSEICKAFQGLSEVQEKEIRHFNETKVILAEKSEKCEILSQRVTELELLVNKAKERKNVFKKKYFKERHVNRKKNKKKNENWLTKIFDWRQIAQI